MIIIKDSLGVSYSFVNYTKWKNKVWEDASDEEKDEALAPYLTGDGEDEQSPTPARAKDIVLTNFILKHRSQVPRYIITSEPISADVRYSAIIVIEWCGDHWEITKCACSARIDLDDITAQTSFPEDLITHRSAWRQALVKIMELSGDSKDYWKHELKVFDKCYRQLAKTSSDNPLLTEEFKDIVKEDKIALKKAKKRLKKLEDKLEELETAYLEAKDAYGKGTTECNEAYRRYESYLNSNEQNIKELKDYIG